MPETTVKVEIDGTPLAADELVRVSEIEVEEATDTGDAAALTAQLEPGDDGGWTSVLDALTSPKTPVAIELSRDKARYRFDGLTTEASWDVAPDAASRVTVKAVDRTLEMNLEEKVARWSGTSDSAIADSILSSYGFTTDVESTPDSPDPDVHVVLQRASDWAFLRSLAAKWGYAVYLDASNGATVGTFKPLDPLASPQGKLSFGFGTDARSVTVSVQLLAGRDVSAARITPLSSEAVSGSDDGTSQAQGSQPLGGKTTVLLAPTDVDGEIDPGETAKGVATRSAFTVRLDALVDTEKIETILRARRTVSVAGLGSTLSGTYLVDRVRHRVGADGHLQRVTLVRNALGNGGML
jgi:phage protein D